MTTPNETISIGHTLGMSLVFTDQNGNPMITVPKPDTVPVWANITPATDILALAASGLTCDATAVAAGADVITATATVGGVAFTATLDVTVDGTPQVLKAATIVSVVS